MNTGDYIKSIIQQKMRLGFSDNGSTHLLFFNFRSVPLQFDSIELERNGNGTELEREWSGNGMGTEREWNWNGAGMEQNGNGMEMEQSFKGWTMEARLRAPSLYTIV